jgi:hypothetical protein
MKQSHYNFVMLQYAGKAANASRFTEMLDRARMNPIARKETINVAFHIFKDIYVHANNLNGHDFNVFEAIAFNTTGLTFTVRESGTDSKDCVVYFKINGVLIFVQYINFEQTDVTKVTAIIAKQHTTWNYLKDEPLKISPRGIAKQLVALGVV